MWDEPLIMMLCPLNTIVPHLRQYLRYWWNKVNFVSTRLTIDSLYSLTLEIAQHLAEWALVWYPGNAFKWGHNDVNLLGFWCHSTVTHITWICLCLTLPRMYWCNVNQFFHINSIHGRPNRCWWARKSRYNLMHVILKFVSDLYRKSVLDTGDMRGSGKISVSH